VSQPTPYDRQASFTTIQQEFPTDPLPGDDVDAELNAIKQTLDEILNNLALIQRDDGAIANDSVGLDQLSGEVTIGFDAPEHWAAATVYAEFDSVFYAQKFYVCNTAHTSASAFSTDVDNWDEIADFTQIGDYWSASSTTSQSIATGAKSFTIEADRFFIIGDYLQIVYDASNYLNAVVTAYSGTSLTVDVETATGSGTYAVWTLHLSGRPGDQAQSTVDAIAAAAAAATSASAAATSSTTASTAATNAQTAETNAETAQAAAEAAAVMGTYYATKAAVEAANVPAPVVAIRIAGYTDEGDGGAALYIRVGAEPTHDGKIQSNDGAWWEIAEVLINIKMFGAVADGTTDCAAALTSALEFIIDLGCGKVIVPAGLYAFNSRVSVVLPDARCVLSIFGDGQNNSILKWTNASGGLQFEFENTRNSLNLRGITLATDENGGGTAIDIVQNATLEVLSKNTFEDVGIRGFDAVDGNVGTNYWTTGINLLNVSFVDFDGVNIWGPSSPTGNGVVIAGTNDTDQSAVVHNFAKCNFWYQNIGLLYDAHTQGVTVTQSNFFGNNAGMLVSGNGDVQLTVVGNQFENEDYAIAINGLIADVMVANNLIFSRSNATGLNIDGGLRYTIVGNSFVGITTTNSYGVHVVSNEATNSGSISGNSYQGLAGGNLFDAATTGWKVDGSNTYVGNTANNTNNSGATDNIIVESGSSGTKFWERSSNGYVRQWGTEVVTLDASGNGSITLAKTFATAAHYPVVSSGDITAGAGLQFLADFGTQTSSTIKVSVRANPGAINVRVNYSTSGVG
jgi:hypothetical protein